jgi:hypothetical protein
MAGTVIADAVQAASTSQLVIKNGVALTPPTINDVNGTQIGTFCRAWVNFNGTGTVAIRASFNVSSITDNGAGTYTVNFTNAMPDANYAVNVTGGSNNASETRMAGSSNSLSTSSVAVYTSYPTSTGGSATGIDLSVVSASVFR